MRLSLKTLGAIARLPVIGGYLTALRRTFDLRGRSGRAEHWSFAACSMAIVGLAWGACGLLGLGPDVTANVVVIALLAHRIPYITLLARRLLDAGLPRAFCIVNLAGDATLWWVEYAWEYPDSDGGAAMLTVGSMGTLALAVQVVIGLLPPAGTETSSTRTVSQAA